MSKYSKSDLKDSMDYLSKIVKPGDTVYCILRKVSRSGMSRVISFYAIGTDGTPHYLDHAFAVILGYSQADNGVKVSGCGMDMGFHVVYAAASVLFRESGFTCVGDHCPSNDHMNGDRDYTPHAHSDPGYALKYRWL